MTQREEKKKIWVYRIEYNHYGVVYVTADNFAEASVLFKNSGRGGHDVHVSKIECIGELLTESLNKITNE